MLTEIYIEALLVNEELADQVWEAWDAGETDGLTAYWAWRILVAQSVLDKPGRVCFSSIVIARNISIGLRHHP